MNFLLKGKELAAQDVERAPEHLAGHGDHVEIGFVGALRFPHVDGFDQRVDVGILDISAFIGGRMAGLVAG